MKKFLAIALALIFALSCAAPAFAATNTCPYCDKVIKSEAAYNKHIASECPVLYPPKPAEPMYCETCGAVFEDPEQYEIHITEIHVIEPSWGDAVGDFFLGLDYSDFKGVLDKITDALTGIGLPGIVNTIIGLLEDAIKGIVDAI